MMPEHVVWDVAVYCHNEETRLNACLESVVAALQSIPSRISIILNGSTDRSQEIAVGFAARNKDVSVFKIPYADKSNAINQFFYRLSGSSDYVAGVDGYTIISPGSFRSLQETLERHPDANAATGVCVNGRSMKLATERTLAIGGQLHGQLHGFRREFIDRIIGRGLRLPVGAYRGDGLLCSMAAHDLDPLHKPWVDQRVRGSAKAEYEIMQLSPWKSSDLARHLRRKLNQMRGIVESAAIKKIIYSDGFEALPATAPDMMLSHIRKHGVPNVPWYDRVPQWIALRGLEQRKAGSPESLDARLVQS